MCVGIPMQVQRLTDGFAWVQQSPNTNEAPIKVETALIATPQVGDWLLVFLNSAREILTPERAAEMQQTQRLIAQAMTGTYEAQTGDVDYGLPSQMDADALREMLGMNKSPPSAT